MHFGHLQQISLNIYNLFEINNSSKNPGIGENFKMSSH